MASGAGGGGGAWAWADGAPRPRAGAANAAWIRTRVGMREDLIDAPMRRMARDLGMPRSAGRPAGGPRRPSCKGGRTSPAGPPSACRPGEPPRLRTRLHVPVDMLDLLELLEPLLPQLP